MNIRTYPQQDILGLKGLVTDRVDRDSFPDETFVYARSTLERGSCPHCNADRNLVIGHGRDEGRFKDVTLHGRKVTIIADRARHRCTRCGRTWTDQIPGLRHRSGMTMRLEDHISERCFVDSFMNVARTHGIDEGTVRNVFERYAAAKEASPRPRTP